MIEKFGINERGLSNEEWLDIGFKMKTDNHISFKNLRHIAEAEHQSKRFSNIANLSGAILFLAFLKFPVIRVQPGFRRVGAATLLAFPFYYYMSDLSQRLLVKRVKYIYRKHLVQNGLHPRVSI